MCRISFERCLCFILILVVSTILFCSGFPIDRREMRRTNDLLNSPTSTNNFLTSLFETRVTREKRDMDKHKIRHSRRRYRHTGRTILDPESIHSTVNPFSKQIRHQSRPLEGRTQRKANPGRRKKTFRCQQQDIARKAYKADIVVLAKAQSMSSVVNNNYSVSFKILKIYKQKKSTSLRVNIDLRLNFLNNPNRMNCESELSKGPGRPVKAQIVTWKEYFLFLNSEGSHSFSVYGTPVLRKTRKKTTTGSKKNRDQETQILRITSESKVREPSVSLTTSQPNPRINTTITLNCTVKGFPTPLITWKKDNITLYTNAHTSINYHSRKTSTLRLKNVQRNQTGKYKCIARSVTGKEVSKELSINVDYPNSNEQECNSTMAATFCNNNGKCFWISDIKEFGCECHTGYKGLQCEEKDVTEESASPKKTR